ncbi:MAG: NAD(P)H-dependent oxidoreductase [Planctomycetota bacterium]
MKYFLVHAHHEPKSFNGALTQRASAAITDAGHEVTVSDLFAMDFDPTSDRRNFATTADSHYLKQQVEERLASEMGGFAPEIESEITKLEACDALIFQFPLWWFGMPAILKGWCDRVLAMGRVYGEGKWYENGIGAGKRALVSLTTGGPEAMYSPDGLNPPMSEILKPINHGVFWFNGFTPVKPFITWGPARMSDDERAAQLDAYARHVLSIQQLPTLPCLPSSEFDPKQGFRDTRTRFHVAWQIADGAAPKAETREAERTALDEWRRSGVLVDSWIAKDHRRGGMTLRVTDHAEVDRLLATLPLADMLRFDTVEIEP